MPMAKYPSRYFNRIRQLRMEKNLSQEELAYILAFKSPSLLSDLENGHKLPPLETALKLGIALQRLVEDIYPQLYDNVRTSIGQRRERFFRRHERSLRKI